MYAALKVLHLGSLIMWLGPAIGSWLVLRYMQQQEGELSPATAKVYRVFFWTITLEHIALCTLLLSGAAMAFHYGFIAMPWLQQKLWLLLHRQQLQQVLRPLFWRAVVLKLMLLALIELWRLRAKKSLNQLLL